MPRPKNQVPTYRLHKQSGQAIVTVTVGGVRKDITLGRHGTPESKEEYRRVLADLASGRIGTAESPDLTVSELCLKFWTWAEGYYRTAEDEPSNELQNLKHAIKPFREVYGHTPAREFGPLAFKRVREEMIRKGWARTFVNAQSGRLKRVIRFGVENELIPADRWEALRAVRGLSKGRTDAPETEPVGPVSDEHVDATLPHLNRFVRGMVEFQRLTGSRPGEVCKLRRCHIDATADVWSFDVPNHKTAHNGKNRVIAIGPKAQAVLTAFPTDAPADYVFSPVRAVAEQRAQRALARQTPRYPSHMRRNAEKRTAKPKRPPAERYTAMTYNKAVARGCKKAGVPVWATNQLRHTHATRVRREFGLEAAQVALGHSNANVTQLYAERDGALAAVVAAKIG